MKKTLNAKKQVQQQQLMRSRDDRCVRRYYLNSNIRPLTNVRKLLRRLISVAELSAIAPNICIVGYGRRISVNTQQHADTITAMDTVTMVTSTNTQLPWQLRWRHTRLRPDSDNNNHWKLQQSTTPQYSNLYYHFQLLQPFTLLDAQF